MSLKIHTESFAKKKTIEFSCISFKKSLKVHPSKQSLSLVTIPNHFTFELFNKQQQFEAQGKSKNYEMKTEKKSFFSLFWKNPIY